MTTALTRIQDTAHKFVGWIDMPRVSGWQIRSLYSANLYINGNSRLPEEDFVNYWLSQRDIALIDEKKVHSKGSTTPHALGLLLFKVIEEANKNIGELTKEESKTVDLVINGISLTISVFKKDSPDLDCSHCICRLSQRNLYTLKRGDISIQFDSATAHKLKFHNYFGDPESKDRIDPTNACLIFNKTEQVD